MLEEYLVSVTVLTTVVLELWQDYFVVIVSEYIYIPWKHAQEQAAVEAAARVSGSCLSTPSVTVSSAASSEAQEVAFLKEQVTTHTSSAVPLLSRD